jgi:hypothetical protein
MQNHPIHPTITRKMSRQRVKQQQLLGITNAAAPKAQMSRQAVR